MESKSGFQNMQQLHEIEKAVRENVMFLARRFGMDEHRLIVNVQQLRGGYGRYAPNAWTVNDVERDELCINPDKFCIIQPAEAIDTILHELVHVYCHRKGDIKETSRNGYYHNRKFKEIAETIFKLTCLRRSSGYNTTSKGNEKYLLDLNEQLPYPFDGTWYRNQKVKDTGDEEETTSNHSFKYACPVCRQSVRGSKKGIKLICGDCRVAYCFIPKKTASTAAAERDDPAAVPEDPADEAEE